MIAGSRWHGTKREQRVRVLIGIDSFLLSDVLGTHLTNDPNCEIVGEVTEPVDLLVAAGETKADVVIMTWPQSGKMPAICTHLMSAYPDLTVIGLSLNGDQSYVCRRPTVVRTLNQSDLASIQEVIRQSLTELIVP